MRTLCVAEAYPWPPRGGYELRLVHQIAALASLGDVDVLCLGPDLGDRTEPPAGVRVLDAPEGPERPATAWLPRWLTSRLPRRLVRRDFDDARGRIPSLIAERYDAVLYCHVDAWLATHDLVRGPGILDFDNLENLSIRGRRGRGPSIDASSPLARRLAARLRWLGVTLIDRIDEGRWDRAQRAAARHVEVTLVCSSIDVGRSGAANAVPVPNGYEFAGAEPSPRPATITDPDAPVFLFVGMLAYEPNHDAARWFGQDVLPLVRRELPGATFRVVGRNPEAVADLVGVDGVEVVGPVADLAVELRRADVAVIPIRFGAGTRLKVVEAMANRLPMVSTTVGCEGIDVTHERELLIADESAAFAEACVRLVRDDTLRSALVEAAQDRYLDRYQWSTIRDGLAALVLEVAERSSATR